MEVWKKVINLIKWVDGFPPGTSSKFKRKKKLYFQLDNNCFTITVLVSAIYPRESVIMIHMSPTLEPPSDLPPHPRPLGCHRAPGLSCLHRTADFHWLSILHMAMYMFQCCCFYSSLPLLPPQYPQVCSLCLSLHRFPANRFISTIFLDYIYLH